MSERVTFDPQSSRLILLGVSEFPESKGLLHPLPGVKNNLHGLRETLTDPDICGFFEQNSFSLLNPTGVSTTAKAVEAAAKKATDTLVVYYSGHGLVTQYGDFHLALHDTTCEASHFDALPFSWLRSAILESPALRRVLIVDCCYSGLALDGFMNESKNVSNFTEIDGTYVLTATQENDLAIARPDEHYTAFTGELIKTLRRGIANAPALLDFGSVYAHLRQILQTKGLPVPDQRIRGNANKLQLIKNRARERSKIAIPRTVNNDRSFDAINEFRNDLLDLFEKSSLIRHSEGSWVTRDLVRLARDTLRDPFSGSPSPYIPDLDTVSMIACLSHTEKDARGLKSCPNDRQIDRWRKRWHTLRATLEESAPPYSDNLDPELSPRFERHDSTLHGQHIKSTLLTGEMTAFSWRAFVRHVLHASREFVYPDFGQLVSSLNPAIRFINRRRRKLPFMISKTSRPTPTILRLSASLGMTEWDVFAARVRYLEMFAERYIPDKAHGPFIFDDDFRYFSAGLTLATERVDQLILMSRMRTKQTNDIWEAVYWPLAKRQKLHEDAWAPYVHYHVNRTQCCQWAEIS